MGAKFPSLWNKITFFMFMLIMQFQYEASVLIDHSKVQKPCTEMRL